MTSDEGKNLLQECLNAVGNVDDYFAYRYGNKKNAVEYAKDELLTKVDYSGEKDTVQYCIKCFIHLGVFVAWKRRNNCRIQQYIVYKKDVVEMQQNAGCDFKEILLRDSEKAYLFRGRDGVIEFYKKIGIVENLQTVQRRNVWEQ